MQFRVRSVGAPPRPRRDAVEPAWSADDIFNETEIEEDRQHSRDVRRAVLGSIAGVAMLVGPVVLSKAMVPDDDTVEVADASPGVAQLKNPRTDEELAAALSTTSAQVPTEADTTETAPTPTEPPPTEPPVTEPTTTTRPEPDPIETIPPGSGGFGDPFDYATWDALADCETGGNWESNTGNGYYGGLQFSLSTWRGVGGTGYPHEHTREEQISLGIKLQQRSGWGQWPACSRKLGLR
jgi:hypothetical protein